ncbi:DUF5690 family protein, partial [Bremerella sp. JC817]|uniref:DUF5690 family protein n=1 Tax=Bremerella sp. JC817 TaxID=3231756 RepID=UPI00345B3CCB
MQHNTVYYGLTQAVNGQVVCQIPPDEVSSAAKLEVVAKHGQSKSELAVVAVTKGAEVGVDIERIREVRSFASMLERCLSDAEKVLKIVRDEVFPHVRVMGQEEEASSNEGRKNTFNQYMKDATLMLFAVVPVHWKVLAIFLNGLPLGMVWGLVVRYLE